MFEIIIVLLCGLFFGSFANVCIYRTPRELSVIKPRSHCTKCNKQITWYENIPVFSYIFLKAKCRGCGSKISIIYPIIEVTCAILFLLMYHLYGFSYILPVFCIFAFSMLVVTAIDFEFQIIPDEFSLLLVIVGFGTSFLNYNLGDAVLQRLLQSFIGFLVGGGSLYVVAVVGKWILKKEAMGGGDIKLMAGVGTFIGWEKVLLAIFIASLIGSIIGITLIVFKKIMKKDAIAFGPYLAAGSMITLFLPPPAVIINTILLFEEQLLLKLLIR
ncbi:MAG: prepilin peptidase [Endomicrobiaceae bacterium]|nr:prepilin peptidase [Endomicrobiaceae bacterium]